MGRHSVPKQPFKSPLVIKSTRAKTALILSGALATPGLIAAAGISTGVYVAEQGQNAQLATTASSSPQPKPQPPLNSIGAGTARLAEEASWAEYDGSAQYYEDRIQTFSEMTPQEIAEAIALGSGGDPSLRGEKNGGPASNSAVSEGGPSTSIPSALNPQPTDTETLQAPHDWSFVAQCESGGNWAINTGNGYYGGLQFSKSTWDQYGGQEFAEYPHQATQLEQEIVAERTAFTGYGQFEPQGPGAWPSCGGNIPLKAGYQDPERNIVVNGAEECRFGPASDLGLTENTAFVYRVVCHEFPAITAIGGWRSGATAQDHGEGRAIDAMVDWQTGEALRDFLLANRDALQLSYVIWAQHIYGPWNGWTMEFMPDRGSVTENHYDHVHISVV